MTKKKAILLIIAGGLLVCCAIFIACPRYLAHRERVENEKKSYYLEAFGFQNIALYAYEFSDGFRVHEQWLIREYGGNLKGGHEYRNYSYVWEPGLYCNLVEYEYNVGVKLTMEEVEEYLSEEFEEDGSVRIYTNGKHPKIQNYVYYWTLVSYKTNEYRDDLTSFELPNFMQYKIHAHDLFSEVILEYAGEHPEIVPYLSQHIGDVDESGSWQRKLDTLDMEVLREFGKKILDPGYEIQLDVEKLAAGIPPIEDTSAAELEETHNKKVRTT